MSKIKAVLAKAVGPAAPPKPPRSADRAVRIDERGRRVVLWPDDDLEHLEHPERSGGWIDRKKVAGWLRR